MKIDARQFRGEVPRVAPQELPANAAQEATNCRLQTGNLEAWRQFVLSKVLSNTGPVQTIHLLNDRWLSWDQQVDVARGVIAGDATYRTYLTCPALWDTPRFTNYALATTGAEPYPVTTRPLGVPAPTVAPTATLTVEEVADNEVALTNAGAESGDTSGWTVVDAGMAVRDSDDVPGLAPYAGSYFFYGGPTAANAESYQQRTLDSDGIIFGQLLTLEWRQAKGAAGSKARMGFRFLDGSLVQIGETLATMLAPSSSLTWTRRTVSATVPEDAVYVRLVIEFENVGGGATDAYIDNIRLLTATSNYTSDGGDLETWSTSTNKSGITGYRKVTTENVGGAQGEVFKFSSDRDGPWIYRTFPFDGAASFTVEYDVMFNYSKAEAICNFGAAAGAGDGITILTTGLRKNVSLALSDRGTQAANLASWALQGSDWCRVRVTGTRSGSNRFRLAVTISNKDTGAALCTAVELEVSSPGTQLVFKHYSPSDDGGNRASFIDNILVSLTPGEADAKAGTATSYVYVFRNDLGEWGAPSLASATIVRPDGGVVKVTTPTTTPPGTDPNYGITDKDIYRFVTGSTGGVYVYVGTVPLATADFVDNLDDSELAGNDVLESEEWDPPPDELQGILALPNGIMAGFFNNLLCLSVAGRPHAWPVKQRYPTESAIVAISNIDNTVVVGTQSFVHTCTGNTPDGYSMSKPGAQQACVSKRGMVYLDQVGVVFPSPDGWMLCTGSAGAVRNLSGEFFTKRQWEAYDPTTIIAAAHDGMLMWWTTGQTPDSGFALDVRPNGFGLIRLSFHATAAHVDPLTDRLYLVLDVNSEPTDADLPLPSTAPSMTLPAKRIYQFDAHASDQMVYRWRGKLNLTPYPLTLKVAKVRGASFTNLLVRIYADGALWYEKVVTNGRAFTLPFKTLPPADSYELELMGTSSARDMQAAEDVLELT